MKKTLLLLLAAFLTVHSALSAINIKGTIKGFDGKSPAVSYARIMQNGKQIEFFDAGSSGVFEFNIPDKLKVSLSFGAVDCETKNVDLIIPPGKNTIELNVTLKPLQTPQAKCSYYVIGQFNSFDFHQGTVPMSAGSDGLLFADIEWPADTLLYQIAKLDSVNEEFRSFNGQQSEFYVYDGGGDYRSGITGGKGKYRITFDPAKFSSFKEPDKIEIPDIVIKSFNKTASKSDYYYRKYLSERGRLLGIEKPKDTMEYLLRKAKIDYMDSLSALVKNTPDNFLRSYIILNYMKVATDGTSFLNVVDKIDTSYIKELLKNTKPESELWSLNYFAGISVYCSMALNEFPESVYLRNILKYNADAKVHSAVYGNTVEQLMRLKNDKAAKKYFKEFIKRYPEDSYAASLQDKYFTVKKIRKGATVPKFSLENIDLEGSKIDNKTLNGKYVLIDFWSLGCGPCLAEMKNLDSAYHKFKDKNFTILSISIDGSSGPVNKYRDKEWKMPWLNAVVGGWKDKITRLFEVTGVPKPILINPAGKILALEGEIRGEKLFRVLNAHLKD